ncbi:hypothetical protein FACS189465_0940 [Clostridia bacterium]|nr:hypothetical protein FACS189465_0940 [Clostridia bacterium]
MITSLMIVCLFTGAFVLLYFCGLLFSSTEESDIMDIDATKLSLTSIVLVNDENGGPIEYQRIFNSENRVWANLEEIPKSMKDAIVAIEDKRFFEHHGVDWVRTGGAVLNLLTNRKNHGGSTLTQQLVKNLTADNELTLTRKDREIRRALTLEKRYSKDEILEAYLNVACFGAGTRGVQAAANTYFEKNILDCSLVQCAAIAAITQNPSAYNPFYHPEKNKDRRELILNEMKTQGKLSETDYAAAMVESENLSFSSDLGDMANKEKTSNVVRNWYIEALLRDVTYDLTEKFKIGKTAAEDILFTRGLKIYCAVDSKVQKILEDSVKENNISPKQEALELGFVMMDLQGRILGTLGSSKQKGGNLLYDRANFAKRQPGSTIKPLAVYAPAIDRGLFNYSSFVPDKPLRLPDGKGDYKNWPSNWYGHYKEQVLLNWAVEKSANAPAAQILNLITPQSSYKFLRKLGFLSLDSVDENSFSALAAGGTHVGVTVREMTAAFQVFGNGGRFYKPHTYFYVTDNNDKVILDNRNMVPIQVIKPETATIMNKLLRNVIIGKEGTGRGANIPNWNVIGKTGTTTDDFDSWFIGLTPLTVSGIWIGYDKPKRISSPSLAIKRWRQIEEIYLKSKKSKEYEFSDEVAEYLYCTETGALATTACPSTGVGYYDKNNLPVYCVKHLGETKDPVDSEKTSDEANLQETQDNASLPENQEETSLDVLGSEENQNEIREESNQIVSEKEKPKDRSLSSENSIEN